VWAVENWKRWRGKRGEPKIGRQIKGQESGEGGRKGGSKGGGEKTTNGLKCYGRKKKKTRIKGGSGSQAWKKRNENIFRRVELSA